MHTEYPYLALVRKPGHWQCSKAAILPSELRQLHTALMEGEERGLQFRQGVPGDLLSDAKPAWVENRDKVEHTTDVRPDIPRGNSSGYESNRSQREVHTAPESLGFAVELEGLTVEGIRGMRTDVLITGTPSGQPCRVAIEFDGPTHYRQHPLQLLGDSTLLRNRQLARRVDSLVCTPWWEWAEVQGNRDAQQSYLKNKLAGVLG